MHPCLSRFYSALWSYLAWPCGLAQLRLVCRWAMLMLLATVRCVHTITEQPGSSLMPRYDYIRYVKTCVSTPLGCDWLDVYLPYPQKPIWKTAQVVYDEFSLISPTWCWFLRPCCPVTWELTDTSRWSQASALVSRYGLRSADKSVWMLLSLESFIVTLLAHFELTDQCLNKLVLITLYHQSLIYE